MFKLGGNFVLIRWLHCCHFNYLVSFDFFVTGQSLFLLESGPGQGNCMQLWLSTDASQEGFATCWLL